MNWHHPDLYSLLFLLAGLATFLAIIYECIQKFRRKPPVVELESLDRGQSAIGSEASAIAIQSALRERQGPSAEGASKPRA
jgi:hypothetical protein